ncbi:protein kinase [bacterium]|nr:protein kinase [bacterium]
MDQAIMPLTLLLAAATKTGGGGWVLIVLDPMAVAALTLVLILLMALLFFRLSGGVAARESSAVQENPSLPRRNRDEVPEHRPVTERTKAAPSSVPIPNPDRAPHFDHDPITAETTPIIRELLPSPPEIRAIELTEPGTAAVQWERLLRWKDAARCHLAAGNVPRAADIYLSLKDRKQAIPLLRDTLMKSPMKETLRLRLIEALVDEGQLEEAKPFIGAVMDPDSPVRASAEFLEAIGRIHEALNRLEDALEYYRLALAMKPSLPEIPQRVLFIRQTLRLDRVEGTKPPYPSPATELLQRYIRESQAGVKQLDASELNHAPLNGYEVIVGHLALGFQKTEPPQSVRSVYSISRRFHLQRLMGESKYSAVFEAVDELLDFPVALKLQRLPESHADLEVLKERLRAVSQLNHPNLAKITFVDRENGVLRVATEYLPGGNLRDFLSRVGGVGMPLLIRMAMHLSSALHSAHLRGVPHGDIRPENILIGHDQRFKLVDFALSPIPVRKIDYNKVAVTDSMDTPKLSDFVVNNEGVQSDLLQMGELLEFLLENTRKQEGAPGVAEASEEFRELVQRLRSGSFASVLRLWQVLEQIFERTLPNGSAQNAPRPRG